MFVDFRIRQNPFGSIDWNPSGESGLESQYEIISDVSLAMFLAVFFLLSIEDLYCVSASESSYHCEGSIHGVFGTWPPQAT